LEKKVENNPITYLHYVVEAVAIVAITFIAIAYMTVGGYEVPIIIAAIGVIGGIAAWDIHKREQE